MIIESSWQGLPTLLIDTGLARCEISLQGAQVLSFIPKAEGRDLLWCSPARLQPGRPVRGGIPICWPWFSRQGRPPSSAQHGFARRMPWTLESVTDRPERAATPGPVETPGRVETPRSADTPGPVEVRLRLQASSGAWPEADWPAACEVSVCITVGASLSVRLITHNDSQESLRLTQALHTYLRVGDVRSTRLSGLKGREYLDNLQGLKRFRQEEDWRFGTTLEAGRARVLACDRIYLQTQAEHLLDDPILARQIRIGSQSNASTVVWNAGPEGILALGDVPAEAWPGYLCVEAAHCLPEDAVDLPPGAQAELSQTLSVIASGQAPCDPSTPVADKA
jgi:glucose-6-phosphate 1-epimerase